MTDLKLTLFYDSQCPLCQAEIRYLEKQDVCRRLDLVDVHSADFSPYQNQFSKQQVMAKLHGIDESGNLLLGLDATYYAWKLVGKTFWVQPIQWRWLRPLLNIMYGFFARHRHRIAWLLTGKKPCQTCQIPNTDNDKENPNNGPT